MPITDPCVIRLLAEGGAIEIFGHKEPDGSWLFIGRGTTLSIDDDGNDSVSVRGIPYFRDLSEALPDALWIKLTPTLVHPELRGFFRERYEAAKATLPDVRCGDEHDEIFAMLRESRLGKWESVLTSTPPDRWSDEESF